MYHMYRTVRPMNFKIGMPMEYAERYQVPWPRIITCEVGFLHSVVSVGVSKLGYTNSIFVDPGVKVSGAYYRDMLLSQQLLPAICQVSGVLINRSARQWLSTQGV